MSLTKISIHDVLATINASYSIELGIVPFSIQYNRADGGIGSKQRCVVHQKLFNENPITQQSKYKYNMNEKGTILLRDLDNNRTFSLNYFLIRKFNGEIAFHE